MSQLAPDLWALSVAEADLADGIYGYWFQVTDATDSGLILMTDPFACAVDRANPAPPPRTNNGSTVGAPASVVQVRDGVLVPNDPVPADLAADPGNYRADLPTNTQMVIYELPTRWVQAGPDPANSDQVGVGTFRDVLAMLSPDVDSPHFSALTALSDREHLVELGINALELLPPADSAQISEWGYGTANYFAADFDLGHTEGERRSRATGDLRALIVECHAQGVRFIQDVVMAFGGQTPYLWIAPATFFFGQSGFGGPLWSYHDPQTKVNGWDPVSGAQVAGSPAHHYMLAAVLQWVSFFHIDGVRIDDVHDINDWFFIGDYTSVARAAWRALGGTDDRFWVVGEELGQSALFARSGYADGSWDETFKSYVRQLCIGIVPGGDLAAATRTMVDCAVRGFPDGHMVVNYIGSHDLTNDRFSDRFYNWLDSQGVTDKEPHIKLAFVCLLTAVGIPMILAGDEFAAERKFVLTDENKQIEPLDLRAFDDPWRRDVFAYVARLVKLRATSPALARNECSIVHTDTTDGRRIVVWQRGVAPNLVIVIANLSDFTSSGGLAGEYVVPGWPTFSGFDWYEVSQAATPRLVVAPGREPLFAWEAKVYLTRPAPT